MIKYPVSRPSLGPIESALVAEVLQSGWITQGKKVAEFESLLADYLRVSYVVACSNGTSALHLALLACGIGPGDEVLVPDLTYVATANVVRYVGATLVLVDINRDTWLIDLDDAESKVTERTKAILPVHLYGMPCDAHKLDEFAGRRKLVIIEDAAEAFGAKWESRYCGTAGLCGTFSFYGNKIITTGEGGAVATNHKMIAERLRLLRGQGQGCVRYHHDVIGYNYRMTDVQAALGIAQMRQLPEFLRKRRIIESRYIDCLLRLDCGIALQSSEHATKNGSVPWLMTCLLPVMTDRAEVMACLAARGIETRPTFVPLHRLPAHRSGSDRDFPNASYVGDLGISLPTYPGLTAYDVNDIVRHLGEVL